VLFPAPFDGRGIRERVIKKIKNYQLRIFNFYFPPFQELVQKIGKDIKNKKLVYKND
jgi:Icc-related predicted phosphoesterase